MGITPSSMSLHPSRFCLRTGVINSLYNYLSIYHFKVAWETRLRWLSKCIVGLFQRGDKFIPQNSLTLHFDYHLDLVSCATSKWRIGGCNQFGSRFRCTPTSLTLTALLWDKAIVPQHYMILHFVSKILCPGMSLTCLNLHVTPRRQKSFTSLLVFHRPIQFLLSRLEITQLLHVIRVKDLGDKLDCHVTFKIHINNICYSASHSVHHIRKIKNFLSRSATEHSVLSMHLFLQYLVSATAFFTAFPPTS